MEHLRNFKLDPRFSGGSGIALPIEEALLTKAKWPGRLNKLLRLAATGWLVATPFLSISTVNTTAKSPETKVSDNPLHQLYHQAQITQKEYTPTVTPLPKPTQTIEPTATPSSTPEPTETAVPTLTAQEKYFEERAQVLEVVENNPIILKSFKKLEKDQILEDIGLYYDIYKGAEMKYGIPWYLLWVVHIHETTVSRDTNPGRWGFYGGMQFALEYYSFNYINEALTGYEYLDRGTRYKGDAASIFAAAKKMDNDANQILGETPQTPANRRYTILQAQYRYCAEMYATQRIKQTETAEAIFKEYGLAFDYSR